MTVAPEPLATASEAAIGAFLQDRAAQLQAAGQSGQAGRFADAYARSLSDLASLQSDGFADDLQKGKELSASLDVALRSIESVWS